MKSVGGERFEISKPIWSCVKKKNQSPKIFLMSITHLAIFFSVDPEKGPHIGLVIITYNQGNNYIFLLQPCLKYLGSNLAEIAICYKNRDVMYGKRQPSTVGRYTLFILGSVAATRKVLGNGAHT